MPPAVDHEARRRRLAEIASAIIAAEGLEAATVRRVAEVAGFSTTVVTHYFANKRELLLWTYRVTAEAVQARFDAALAHDPADLMAGLEILLPIGAAGVRAWRVYFAFWQMAARDPGFAAEQRWWTDHAGDLIAGLIRARHGGDPTLAAKSRMLLVTLQGLAIQALFDAETWSPARQRDFLATQIALLFGTA